MLKKEEIYLKCLEEKTKYIKVFNIELQIWFRCNTKLI